MSSTPQPPQAITAPPPPPQQAAPTQAEVEYRELRAHFQTLVMWTVIGLSIITAAGAALLYQSVSDAGKHADQAIQATKDYANAEISRIRDAAETTARSEAQKAIQAQFDRQNVQRMIDSETQRRVDAAVEFAVNKNLGARIDAFRNLVAEIGEISNHGAQLRLGFRSGLDYLLKKKESPDPTIRAYASSTLRLIAADYAYTQQSNPPMLPGAAGEIPLPTMTPKQLMQAVHTAQDPLAAEKMARAFHYMKQKVGWNVDMFDVTGADKWCAQNKPKCDE